MNSIKTFTLCNSALPKCKINELFFHKSHRFSQIFSLHCFNGTKRYNLLAIYPFGSNSWWSKSRKKEKNEHYIDFWANFMYCFQYQLDFCSPFWGLLAYFRIIFVEPCLATCFDAFCKYGSELQRFRMSKKNSLRYWRNSFRFLKKTRGKNWMSY